MKDTTYIAVFRHTNLTQRVGIGYDRHVAMGSNATQNITLESKSTGSVILRTNGIDRLTVDGDGALSCGAITCITINTNGNTNTCGALTCGGVIAGNGTSGYYRFVRDDTWIRLKDATTNHLNFAVGKLYSHDTLYAQNDSTLNGNLTVNGSAGIGIAPSYRLHVTNTAGNSPSGAYKYINGLLLQQL